MDNQKLQQLDNLVGMLEELRASIERIKQLGSINEYKVSIENELAAMRTNVTKQLTMELDKLEVAKKAFESAKARHALDVEKFESNSDEKRKQFLAKEKELAEKAQEFQNLQSDKVRYERDKETLGKQRQVLLEREEALEAKSRALAALLGK